MTIRDILREAENLGCRDRLAAEVWLAFLLEKDRAHLFARPEHQVDQELEQKFLSGVEQMVEGKPLAQLTGHKEFFGLDFEVNEQVLIPRPESELIVELVRDYLNGHPYGGKVTVADIGTGSGCILLSILKNLGFGRGIGVEKSEEALKVAGRNAERLGLSERVSWQQGNLLEPLIHPVQIIVANLPYIGRERFNFVADNVARFEPEMALYGGADGLDLYRQMFEQLMEKDWRVDLLVGEFGFGQEEEMTRLLEFYFDGYDYRVIPDLAGIPRVFVVEFARPHKT